MKRSLLLLLLLAACVGRPKQVEVPAPQPRPAPPPMAVLSPVAWEDRARTAGNWTYRRDGAGSVAEFKNAEQSIFTITCGAGRVTLHRPSPEALVMTVTTTTSSKRFLGSPDSLTHGAVGTLPANDPLLDAIIYSRGKFMVSATGLTDLILPPWPEIARVVEDCRN